MGHSPAVKTAHMAPDGLLGAAISCESSDRNGRSASLANGTKSPPELTLGHLTSSSPGFLTLAQSGDNSSGSMSSPAMAARELRSPAKRAADWIPRALSSNEASAFAHARLFVRWGGTRRPSAAFGTAAMATHASGGATLSR